MTELLAPASRLIDAESGVVLTGATLHGAVGGVGSELASLSPGVVFVLADTTIASVLRYLGAWSAHRPVALLDPALAPQTLAMFIERYQPAAVLGAPDAAAPAGYLAAALPAAGPTWRRIAADAASRPHPDLGILLATSGSTGDPKLVRLSRETILHNATAIGAALGITAAEVAPTSLPLFYSYGMSVLNSHLVAGATVVVADGGVLSRDFWSAFDRHRATSLAGVPYSYEMLARIRWTPAKHPTLRTLTQAGGRMRPDLITAFHEKIAAVGGGLFVMYGQTEAGPRMTTLPAGALPAHVGSVGPALPGGRIAVLTEDGAETEKPHVSGEIIYYGPNVMMGYAEAADDLARGDDCGARLATGDLGHLDEQGHLWLTGRLKRIGKVFGIRINLDDVERLLREYGPVAAVPAGDTVMIWCEGADEATRTAMAALVADRLKLHKSGFTVRSIDRLPLLGSGKVDYRSLEAT